MPELPEVETIVRSLQAVLVGKKITTIYEIRKGILQDSVEELQKIFLKKQILQIFRHGKYILFDFEGDYFLVAHLRMTGKFIYPSKKQSIHDRVVFVFEDKQKLAFNDVRCFGTIEKFLKKNSFICKKKLGIDALAQTLSAAVFYNKLRSKKKSIKKYLMDQSQIAGIGNIYACEILYKSSISPFRLTNSLNLQEVDKLLINIRKILTLAISYNGTSISDYRRVDGKTGEFQNFLLVYGKNGQKCTLCKEPIQKEKGQQSTYYCPTCQN